jgi:DNA-binding FadR family transcriptional regulator
MGEHRAIVERIAAGQAAAAGRALHEHAMASRDRVHRVHDTAAQGMPQARRGAKPR